MSQLKLVQANVREHFQDETGYECFVNHIHLEDLLVSADKCVLVEQALVFARELNKVRANSGIHGVLEYIISADEDGVNVRFHVLRPKQYWLADDLDAYAECVAALRLPAAEDIP